MPSALITGIQGQDGSYLAEFLVGKGYTVHGVVKSVEKSSNPRLSEIFDRVKLHSISLTDASEIRRLIETTKPDEIYNFASPSFIPNSWLDPVKTSELVGLGVLTFLESIRQVNPKIKFMQSGSSEMFGQPTESPQNEKTPIRPLNPYSASKAFAHFCIDGYRAKYDLFACVGIMFNHESPRRSLDFVTRKITNAVAKIKLGKLKQLPLGNTDAIRDWGYAKEYVEALWLVLQQNKPDDYVIATGKGHSVKQLIETAFSCAGLNYKDHVSVDKSLWRPIERMPLVGDPSKIKNNLGWSAKTAFKDLIQLMVEADLAYESKNPR